MAREDRRQRVDDVLDPLVRREQPEGQDHRLALDAEPVLAAARDGHARDAVRDQVDLARPARRGRRAAAWRRGRS